MLGCYYEFQILSNRNYFFQPNQSLVVCIMKIFSTQLNALFLFFDGLLLIHMAELLATFIIGFEWIIRLNYQQIFCHLNQWPIDHLNIRFVRQFLWYNYHLFRFVDDVLRSYSHFFLIFLFYNWPSNLYIIGTLMRLHVTGRQNLYLESLIISVFLQECFGIFFIHYICTKYSKRIHYSIGLRQLMGLTATTMIQTTKIPSSVSIKSVKLTSIPSHKSKAISSSFPESSHNSLTQAINIGKVGLSTEKIFLSNGNASKMAKSSRTTNNIHHSSTDISVIGAKEKTTTTTTTSSNKKKSSNRKSMANNIKYSKKNRANAGNSNSQQQSNGNSNAPSLNTSCYQQPHDPHDGHHQLQESQSTIVDYKVNGQIKPPFSYATLICMAMKANKNKMTLSSIYKWIKENFLYYKNADPNWQVCRW